MAFQFNGIFNDSSFVLLEMIRNPRGEQVDPYQKCNEESFDIQKSNMKSGLSGGGLLFQIFNRWSLV